MHHVFATSAPTLALMQRLLSHGRRSAGIVAAALLAALHVAAAFTENINWDEFALFERVADMLRTHRMRSGGRPGAANWFAAPFVRDCDDAIATVQSARLFWAVVTFAGVVALYRLLLQMRAGRARPGLGAALGVAVFVLALPFLRWSIQVRTDQLTLAFGLWGSVALYASERRRAWAWLGGMLYAIGFLCSQKAAYLGVLACVLLVLWPSAHRQANYRAVLQGLALRALRALMAFAATYAAYQAIVPLFVAPPKVSTLAETVSTMDYYRQTFGSQLYLGMLSGIKAHGLLLVLMAIATARAMRGGQALRTLSIAWLVLALGAAIALFHAGIFPYFWMTLGVFPAVAFGACAEELLDAVPVRGRRAIRIAIGAVFVLPAFVYAASLLRDTQRPQREALDFIAREFHRGEYGLQLEGALFCRTDPAPFPALFRDAIDATFSGPSRDEAIARFTAQFEQKPVSFVIFSHMMPYFPAPVVRFWLEHYQPYNSTVRVAGNRMRGDPTREDLFSIIVPGRYRWLPSRPASVPLQVDGRRLEPSDTLELDRGEHRVRYAAATDGALVLALDSRPQPSTAPFYAPRVISEIIGGPYWPP